MPARPIGSRWSTVDVQGTICRVRLTPGAAWRVLPFSSRCLLLLSVAFATTAFAVPMMTYVIIAPAGTGFANMRWYGLGAAALIGLQNLVQAGLVLYGRGAGERIASHHLRRGRCPTCGYDLTRSPTNDDGIVTCSECGSAWRTANPPPHPARTDSERGGGAGGG
jgi:hypothetical protein